MNQEFKIGNLKILQDEQGYGVSQEVEEGVWQVVATFLNPLDALRYFTEYCMTLEQIKYDYHGKETYNIDKDKDNNKK